MKKLLFIITCGIMLSSCFGRRRPNGMADKPFIVLKIQPAKSSGSCKYIGKQQEAAGSRPAIVDTCGKFQIGDTIIFVKK